MIDIKKLSKKVLLIKSSKGLNHVYSRNKESLAKAISEILAGHLELTTEKKEEWLKKIRLYLKRLRDADK